MALKKWIGSAGATFDVWTVEVDVASTGDDIGVTVGDKTVSVECLSNTEADEAARLHAALADSNYPEFREYTWAVLGTTITATAGVAGIPGVLTEFGNGSADVTVTNTVPATGPNDAGNAINWSGGTLPTDTDDVIIEKSNVGLLYGLDALYAVSLTSLKIQASFTGAIGLPERNTSGGGYYEYRGRYWQLAGNPAIDIGDGPGSGSARLNLDVGTGSCVLRVHGTGSPQGGDIGAINLINGGGNNTLIITQGNVAVAAGAGETAEFQTVRVGHEGNPASDATLTLGTGTTVATILQYGGIITNHVAVTALTMGAQAGQYHQLVGTVTAATIYGGTFYGTGTGTYTALTCRGPNAAADFSRSPQARTITNGEFTGGARLIDPNGLTTWSNPLTWDAASLKASDLGPRFSLART